MEMETYLDCLCYHNIRHAEWSDPAVIFPIDAQLLFFFTIHIETPLEFGSISAQFIKRFKGDSQEQLRCHRPYVFGNKQKQIPCFIEMDMIIIITSSRCFCNFTC